MFNKFFFLKVLYKKNILSNIVKLITNLLKNKYNLKSPLKLKSLMLWPSLFKLKNIKFILKNASLKYLNLLFFKYSIFFF